MWLIRFHLIETRDYNRVDRFCHKIGFAPKKFSAMLLVKGVILSIFQKKSWRQIGNELNISHLPVYNFFGQVRESIEFRELIEYFIERRILLSIHDERHITKEYLETDDIIEKSRQEWKKFFSTDKKA